MHKRQIIFILFCSSNILIRLFTLIFLALTPGSRTQIKCSSSVSPGECVCGILSMSSVTRHRYSKLPGDNRLIAATEMTDHSCHVTRHGTSYDTSRGWLTAVVGVLGVRALTVVASRTPGPIPGVLAGNVWCRLEAEVFIPHRSPLRY